MFILFIRLNSCKRCDINCYKLKKIHNISVKDFDSIFYSFISKGINNEV